jgi:uncharacterized membrane protein YjdF
VLVLVVLVWSGIAPADRFTWVMGYSGPHRRPVLILTYTRFRFTRWFTP